MTLQGSFANGLPHGEGTYKMGSSDSGSYDPSKMTFTGEFDHGRPIFKREQADTIGSAPTTPRSDKEKESNHNNSNNNHAD